MRKSEGFLSQIGKRKGCPLFIISIQQSTEVLARAIKQERKDIQTGKKEVKLSLFSNDMIQLIENLKDISKKLPD